jgi:hypothetical protein
VKLTMIPTMVRVSHFPHILAVGLGVLFGAILLGPAHAGKACPDNIALLTISMREWRLASAGMSCIAVRHEGRDQFSTYRQCERRTPPEISLRRDNGILNSDIVAFDVTGWPRQAIAELAARVDETEDAANDDLSGMRIGYLRVKQIMEGDGEPDFGRRSFDLGSGSYLLMSVRCPDIWAAGI